jgi:Holliday junction resolvase RusA-like endonuclease
MKLTIQGEPVAKGRPRVCKWGTYTPAKTVNYETLIKEMFMVEHGEKLRGALRLFVIAYFSIPKSASKKNREKMIKWEIRPTKKPDLDNIMKIVSDALNTLAYDDDSQIVSATIKKFYSDEPRLFISVEETEELESEVSDG